MEIRKLWDKPWKKAAIAAFPIIAGTYSGNEGGFVPFYNKKVGTSYGINISGVTEFMPGSKFYGINLSLFNYNKGTINGLNFGIVNGSEKSTINGLNISIVNTSIKPNSKINGLEASLLNIGSTEERNFDLVTNVPIINGLQIGIANGAKSGNCAQIGLINYVEHGKNNAQIGIYNQIEKPNGKKKRGLLLNYHFRGRGN